MIEKTKSLSSEPSLPLKIQVVCLEAAILLERYAEKEGGLSWRGKEIVEGLRALGSSEPSAPPSDSRTDKGEAK